jgi:alpha-mannosidase
VLSIQGVADGCIAGGRCLVEHHSNRTCVSAIKQHEVRDTLVVRIYNLGAESATDTLSFGQNLAAAWVTNLLEERIKELETANRRELTVELGPNEITTLEVEFGS